MNSLALFAAAGLADTARQTAEQFGLTWPHFIAQCLSFLIVAFALHRFAYRPILQVLEERRQRIKEGLDNAEKIRAELARTEAARQEVLNQANRDANKLVDEARAAADRERTRLTQEAVAQVNQMIAKARESNEGELARMKAELRKEVGRLVIETTARVTGKVLTVQDHERLVEETNRELAA